MQTCYQRQQIGPSLPSSPLLRASRRLSSWDSTRWFSMVLQQCTKAWTQASPSVMYSLRLSQVYAMGMVFIPSRQQSRSRMSLYWLAGGSGVGGEIGQTCQVKITSFQRLIMQSHNSYMFLHNVVMTSVMVLARFFLEGTWHFNSENPTHSVSFARQSVRP